MLSSCYTFLLLAAPNVYPGDIRGRLTQIKAYGRLVKIMNETRIFPRAPADYPIEIGVRKGEIIHTTLVNVSRNGVMISACHQHFEQLLAANHNVNLNEPLEVDLQFKLGADDSAEVIATHARAIYVRRIAQDQYHLGFKFLKISQQTDGVIKAYVEENLPAPPLNSANG